MEKLKKLYPSLLIVLAASLWGILGIFVRQLSSLGLTNIQVTGYRCIITGLLLSPLLFTKKNDCKFKLSDIKNFVGSGIISIIFFNFCYFSTINLTSLSIASILLYTAPIFVTIIAYFLFKEKITRVKIFALILSILGCAFVTGIFNEKPTITLEGFLLGIGSGLGYGLYSIFARLAMKRYNAYMVACYTFIFAGVFSLFIVDLPTTLPIIFSSFNSVIVLLSLGFFSGVLPYILYNIGLSKIQASNASVIASMEPVVASIVGILLFNEKMSFSTMVGAILVLFAVISLNINFKRKESN